jgi:hypothetical protein
MQTSATVSGQPTNPTTLPARAATLPASIPPVVPALPAAGAANDDPFAPGPSTAIIKSAPITAKHVDASHLLKTHLINPKRVAKTSAAAGRRRKEEAETRLQRSIEAMQAELQKVKEEKGNQAEGKDEDATAARDKEQRKQFDELVMD